MKKHEHRQTVISEAAPWFLVWASQVRLNLTAMLVTCLQHHKYLWGFIKSLVWTLHYRSVPLLCAVNQKGRVRVSLCSVCVHDDCFPLIQLSLHRKTRSCSFLQQHENSRWFGWVRQTSQSFFYLKERVQDSWQSLIHQWATVGQTCGVSFVHSVLILFLF